jgi:hypothetical protein
LLSHIKGRTQSELIRIFFAEREGVTEEWKRPYNEELHNLYSSPDIIRMIDQRG